MSILSCRINIQRGSHFTQSQAFCAVHSQVMLQVECDPVIACGEGALHLEEVEIEAMTSDEGKALIGKSLRTRLIWNAAELRCGG